MVFQRRQAQQILRIAVLVQGSILLGVLAACAVIDLDEGTVTVSRERPSVEVGRLVERADGERWFDSHFLQDEPESYSGLQEVDGLSVSTDAIGEAKLVGNHPSVGTCRVYVFRDTAMQVQKSDCARSTRGCDRLDEGFGFYDRCEGYLVVVNDVAEIQIPATQFMVAYLPEREVALVIVVDGWIQTFPLRSGRRTGNSTTVQTDQFWFTSPTNQTIAGLQGQTSYPLRLLPSLAQELGVGDVLVRWREVAAEQGFRSDQNVAPIASFEIVEDGSRYTFFALPSTDPDGDIVEYVWDFGDGTTGRGLFAAHSFRNPGTYTVRLTVTDDRGAVAVTSRSINIVENLPPVAQFDRVGDTFDASASFDPDGDIVDYFWNFGDGTTRMGRVVQFPLQCEATTTVTLTVTDNQGATASASMEYRIIC